jgi:hypothetical protein
MMKSQFASNKDYLFNVGNPSKFMDVKDMLISKFAEAGVLEFVLMEPEERAGATNEVVSNVVMENGISVTWSATEYTFGLTVPPTMEQYVNESAVIESERKHSENDRLLEAINDINQFPVPTFENSVEPNAEGLNIRMTEIRKARLLRLNIPNEIEQWKQRRSDEYRKMINEYDTAKARHFTLRAKCYEVFKTNISNIILFNHMHDLNNYKFRTVWRKLEVRFSIMKVSTQAFDILNNKMRSLVFHKEYDMNKHITQFRELVQHFSEIGQVLTREYEFSYFKESLRRGNTFQVYEHLFRYFEFKRNELWTMNDFYEEVLNIEVQTREQLKSDMLNNKQSINKYNSTNKPKDRNKVYKVSFDEKVVEQKLNSSTIGGDTKRCLSCNKTGHMAKDCWKDITCDTCKKKGHPTKVCRTRKRPSDGSQDKSSSKLVSNLTQRYNTTK